MLASTDDERRGFGLFPHVKVCELVEHAVYCISIGPSEFGLRCIWDKDLFEE